MQALGSIEVVGLVAGVEAADVACKTADVTLIGYELARGGGYVTVKVEGQVAAVQAAMAAAEVAASKLTRVVSRIVIPRPHQELEPIVFSAATVGLTKPAPGAKATKPAAKAKAPEKTKPASKTETKAQEKPEPESGAGTTSEPGPEPKAITKPEPKPQLEQAQPESGPDQKPDATPKNPAETTKAPRTSTTRRKQS
ncbi:BMC domain-containing protein [Arachnia propionica]|uniref:BMC domain-containing protein n=1 Tax=Arachnia propionica TaxID=1750 RepID=UPI000F6F5157|nr:BMC domain-containing protein [Arachnia propionica]VEJ59907.1 Propanediol utilization protein PduA [Arachnia propionica]